MLPSTAVVLGADALAVSARLLTLLGGLLVLAAAYAQPTWAPRRLWSRRFANAYFAAAMAITALWELALAVTSTSLTPSLLAAAAGLAGAASLATARRA
jgi:hypothetical protein